MVNDNSLEDLRMEYYKYKEKKYKFGKYGTREQILDEFLKGKIFVLKGGLRVGGWILTILVFAISFISLFILLLPNPDTGIFIIPLIFTFPTGLISLLTLRKFLVIGPLGVYYRKILSSGVFSWNDVNNIKHFTQTYKGFTIGVVVKIYISYGRKIRFGSSTYLNKEFPKKIEREMFFTLFYIYSQRGQKKISQSSIQKSVTYSQLKEQLLSSFREKIQLNIKGGDMINKRIKILEEIMKNDAEYKILLARKEAGESVEDLIKQNRNYADILAKKNKKKSEEAAKWFALLEERRIMDPYLARDSDIRLERGLKITNEIKKNEEEYEKLLERKNKGEYVDDLIKQNRYTAKVLAEQNKKVWD